MLAVPAARYMAGHTIAVGDIHDGHRPATLAGSGKERSANGSLERTILECGQTWRL